MSVVVAAETRRDLTSAELDVVRALLAGADPEAAQARLSDLREDAPASALDEVQESFGLTSFERAVLLLVCAPDLVGQTSRELTEQLGAPRPSFATAIAHLPGAHWDAASPNGPLRAWSLVRPVDEAAPLTSPLVADERIVHHLAGVVELDERLALLSRPAEGVNALPQTFERIAREIVAEWATGQAVRLRGPQPANLRTIAAAAGMAVGLEPRVIGAADLPADAAGLAGFVRLLARESALGRVSWILETDDGAPAPSLLRALEDCAPGVVVVESGPASTARPGAHRVIEVPRLPLAERIAALRTALAAAEAPVDAAEIARAAGGFDLPLRDLARVAREVAGGAELWTACRRRPLGSAGSLAQVLAPRARWDDLVLPADQLEQLRALVSAVRHRPIVLDEWGFAERSGRGLGTIALFAGASGTGKTFAAEVVAGELGLDLLHVDLSQIVDKYLGETEKRLASVFEAAEDGGVVLLFDEADALFGKRSEVKDSHDRYANVEIAYLLQRLEAFGGLAILTTNARSALDQAFTRRISTIVDFPYPDRDARLRLWERALPAATPRDGLDLAVLAAADLSGGSIGAAALQAAYLAAASGGPLTQAHATQAVRWELAKSGRVAANALRVTGRA